MTSSSPDHIYKDSTTEWRQEQVLGIRAKYVSFRGHCPPSRSSQITSLACPPHTQQVCLSGQVNQPQSGLQLDVSGGRGRRSRGNWRITCASVRRLFLGLNFTSNSAKRHCGYNAENGCFPALLRGGQQVGDLLGDRALMSR